MQNRIRHRLTEGEGPRAALVVGRVRGHEHVARVRVGVEEPRPEELLEHPATPFVRELLETQGYTPEGRRA